MRRLLLINAVLLLVLATSCQDTQMNKSKTPVQDSAALPHTGTSGNDSLPASVSGKASETDSKSNPKADSSAGKKPKAIIHSAPDQDRIDSIKEAKTKGKK